MKWMTEQGVSSDSTTHTMSLENLIANTSPSYTSSLVTRLPLNCSRIVQLIQNATATLRCLFNNKNRSQPLSQPGMAMNLATFSQM